MQQGRSDMGENEQDQPIGQKTVQAAQGTPQMGMEAHERRDVAAPPQGDRVSASREHGPADQRQGDHEAIEQDVGEMGGQLHGAGHVRRQGGGAVGKPVDEPDDHQQQEQEAHRAVQGEETGIVDGGVMRHDQPDEEHDDDEGRHHPVQQDGEAGEGSGMACILWKRHGLLALLVLCEGRTGNIARRDHAGCFVLGRPGCIGLHVD